MKAQNNYNGQMECKRISNEPKEDNPSQLELFVQLNVIDVVVPVVHIRLCRSVGLSVR